MSLKIVTVTIEVLPAVVPLCEFNENIAGEDQLIGTNEVSLDDYERGRGVAIAMVLLHNLRRLYCVANYLHHSSIRRYGDLFAAFADFLTASRSPNTARIADFPTTVFQLLRYEMVQAYRRLVHLLCHEDRTAVNACLREFVSSQPWFAVQRQLKQILRQRINFVGGVTRIKHAQKQQPLSDMTYGSSWHWNYRSFRMITPRYFAASWDDTHVAAKAA